MHLRRSIRHIIFLSLVTAETLNLPAPHSNRRVSTTHRSREPQAPITVEHEQLCEKSRLTEIFDFHPMRLEDMPWSLCSHTFHAEAGMERKPFLTMIKNERNNMLLEDEIRLVAGLHGWKVALHRLFCDHLLASLPLSRFTW